jgi:hypothetical protein
LFIKKTILLNLFKYKNILFNLAFLICLHTLDAQELSIQIAPGLINYGGDLRTTFYTFQEAQFSISGAVMYRINKWALRGNATYGRIKAGDIYPLRNLSFESKIADVSLCLEYDFFNLDNEKKFTPYVFGGPGLFHYNPYTYFNSKKIYLKPLSTEGQGLSIYSDRDYYPLTQFEVPLGVGIRYKLSDHFRVGLEFCSRYLFTDYLDDVSTTYPDENTLLKERSQLAVDLSFRGDEVDPSAQFPSGRERGNPSRNDNYYTGAISLIYVFQNSSLFGGTGTRNKKIHGVDCPKVQ